MPHLRFGVPPHGGFGFGLTRLLKQMLSIENVREVTSPSGTSSASSREAYAIKAAAIIVLPEPPRRGNIKKPSH